MNFPRSLLLALSLLLAFGNFARAAEVRVVRTPSAGAVPDAEVGQDGALHLAYVERDDVFYVRSTDNGSTFTAPRRVNSEPGTAHPPSMFRGPDLAVGRDETVHLIWYVNAYQRKRPSDEWGVYYSRLIPPGTEFAPARNLNHKPSDNYSLAANARGEVAVVWMADGLFIDRSSDNGSSFAPTAKVGLADSCECCASRALFGREGSLFVAYRDKAENHRDMYLLEQKTADWSRVKASGVPWIVNACPMTGTFLSRAGDEVVMAWETKGAISYARFDAAGKMLGRENLVPLVQGKYPVVLAAPDGETCVSWKNGTRLQWARFGRNGDMLGEISSQTSRNSDRHAGAVTRSGSFLLID